MTLTGLLKTTRFELRSLAGRKRWSNAPIRAFNEWRHPERQSYVDDRTDLLIDGFQGSANTFAVRCLRSAQTKPLNIAHHCHAPEQAQRAAAASIPAMVTLREPVGAARSTLRRWPDVSPKSAIRGYIRYYEAIEPIVDRLFLAEFDHVTTDFGRVMESLNRMFDTEFEVFVHTEHNARVGYDPPVERRQTITSDRDAAGRRLSDPALEPLLERARLVHDRLVAAARVSGGSTTS